MDFTILGADFLRHHKLIVDLASGYLKQQIPSTRRGPQRAAATFLVAMQGTQYPDVVNDSGKFPLTRGGGMHMLETTGHWLDPSKLLVAKTELHQLERQGFVHQSRNNWRSPLHMVKKTDGSWHFCGDYRRLN